MLWDILLFTLGIAILVGGAEIMLRGGSKVAAALGMSPLMIGLTVVAVGTSAPELVVSVVASATNHPEVALGNVVGSNIMNTLIVLGTTAVLYPVVVHADTVRKDLPMVVAASVFVLVIAWDGLLSAVDGLLLLAMMVLYLHHLYDRERGRIEDRPERDARATSVAWIGVGAGALLLVLGGDLVVDAGTRIAESLGVPERVIALTLVAFGTSAPELATSLVAAFRKQVDLAVGNVVGSNLLNLFFVLGSASIVGQIPVSGSMRYLDLPVMAVSTIIILQFASSRFRIRRSEGVAMMALYGFYLGIVLVWG